MEVFIAIVVVIAGVAAALYGHRMHQKRLAELAAWARAEGWTWDPERRKSPRYPFALFSQGHTRFSRYHAGRDFAGATPGLDSAHVELFEYHYAITTSNGKTTTTHHYYFTCAAIDPGADLGHVSIRDEHIGDKIAQAVGFDDIDLEDPDFSKKFVVKARNRKDAYDLIDHALQRYLISHSGWRIETAGRLLFIHRKGRISIENYNELVRFALGFLAQLPRTLVNAERAARGQPPLIEAGSAAPESRRKLPEVS